MSRRPLRKTEAAQFGNKPYILWTSLHRYVTGIILDALNFLFIVINNNGIYVIRQLMAELTAAQEAALLDVSDYLELSGHGDEEEQNEMSDSEVGPKEGHGEPRAFPSTSNNESVAAPTSGSTDAPGVWGGARALPFTTITETLVLSDTSSTANEGNDSSSRVAKKGKGKYVSPSGTVYVTKVSIANEIMTHSERASGK